MKSKEEDFVLWPPTTWKPTYHDDGGDVIDNSDDDDSDASGFSDSGFGSDED